MRTWGFVSILAATALVLSGCTIDNNHPGKWKIEASAEPPADAAASAEVFTPIVGSVLAPPLAVPSTDGKTHLAYELLLTNVLGQPVTLNTVSVQSDGFELLRLEADDLTPWVRPLGAAGPGRVLAAGQQATVMLDVILLRGAEPPKKLTHLIELSPETPMPPIVDATMQQEVAPTEVSAAKPVVISSPVKGKNWLDGNSCCDVTPHRQAINPINGSLFAPERFAIDFVQLDADGKIFSGAIDSFDSYDYFGADIVAVADGPIVSMSWDLPDVQPGAHPTGLTLQQYGGNHIVQDIGGGRYAFYAHLRGGNPEGLEVGQKLKRRQVIGQLGNSGNTDMPHLHFHIMDSPLPLGSNGLPFLIESFALEGTVAEPDLFACMEASIPCKIEAAAAGEMSELGLLYGNVASFGG